MAKNTEIIVFLIFLGITTTILVFIFFNNARSLWQPTAAPSFIPTPILPEKSSEEKIYINGLAVNNFLIVSKRVSDTGDAIIVQKNDYSIVYLQNPARFVITILSFPFSTNRILAEKDFLNTLGINEEDACGIPVSVTTIASVNKDMAGKDFSLSFCGT